MAVKPSTQHHSAAGRHHTAGRPSLDSCAGGAVRPSWIMRRWGRFIAPASRKYRVNAALIAAIITKESEGNPRAWNHASDARGLMQVLHGSWSPRANIDRGTGLFALYHRRFRSLALALAAYNAGPGTVARYGGIPPFWETQRYVPAVTALYLRYRCAQLSIAHGRRRVTQTAKRRR